jgi:hypothetical protein
MGPVTIPGSTAGEAATTTNRWLTHRAAPHRDTPTMILGEHCRTRLVGHVKRALPSPFICNLGAVAIPFFLWLFIIFWFAYLIPLQWYQVSIVAPGSLVLPTEAVCSLCKLSGVTNTLTTDIQSWSSEIGNYLVTEEICSKSLCTRWVPNNMRLC